MNHFPVGMEMFSAADEEQWEIISEAIDVSDYYVLIVGNKYGSIIQDGEDAGISYTEKEFRYSLQQGVPVLAFVIADDATNNRSYPESPPYKAYKLALFEQAVKTGRVVNFWHNADELAAQLTSSLYKAVKKNKRLGWLRTTEVDIDKSLAGMKRLTERVMKCIREVKYLKTYIIFSGIANIVAGGPIYVRNKILYLERNEWQVVLLPIDDGKIYITGFEKYSGKSLPFLTHMPGEFSRSQLKKCLDLIIERIPKNSTKIVIESGTHFTALWGELLAKELGAKHVVFWLDENNKFIHKKEQDFLYFKYKRNELACITDNAMRVLFHKYHELSNLVPKSLSFDCTNSVEDYESPITNLIPQGDYTLGTIGRIDKKFVSNITDAFIKFADKVPNKTVVCVFLGGGSSNSVNAIKEKAYGHENIKLYFTDYIYPIPLKLIKSIQLFVSGAGSAFVSAKYGLPTINVDMYSCNAQGYLVNSKEYSIYRPIDSSSIFEYIYDYFINNRELHIKKNCDREWIDIENSFSRHMAFIDASSNIKDYYSPTDICKLCMNMKRKVYRLIFILLGIGIPMLINKKIKSILR